MTPFCWLKSTGFCSNMLHKYADLSVGDLILAGKSASRGQFLATVELFNDRGQPYVLPRGSYLPCYLVDEEVAKLTVLRAYGVWEPSPADIAWSEQLLTILAPMSKWGMPRSFNHYIIDKSRKLLYYVGGGIDTDDLHLKTIKTFEKLGFLTVDARYGVPVPLGFDPEPGILPPGITVLVI